MRNKTLVIIKPDAIQRNLIVNILSRLQKEDLHISNMRIKWMDKPLAEEFYGHVKEKVVDQRIFYNIVDYMGSMPLLFLVFEGNDVAKRIKTLAGATDPSKAAKGTIRGDFGIDTKERADRELRPVKNLIHTSDPEAAEKEIKMFFD
jgi:nucleoside-diphosphate kinase